MPEHTFEACGHGVPLMTPCVKRKGHDGFHETEQGTEFTNSGKVGLGKLGDDFRLAKLMLDDQAKRGYR